MLGLPSTLISCATNDNLYPVQKDTLALAIQRLQIQLRHIKKLKLIITK